MKGFGKIENDWRFSTLITCDCSYSITSIGHNGFGRIVRLVIRAFIFNDMKKMEPRILTKIQELFAKLDGGNDAIRLFVWADDLLGCSSIGVPKIWIESHELRKTRTILTII